MTTVKAKPFELLVVGANLGRKYETGVYMENVRRIMRLVRQHEHYALLLQEIDEEPDPANEHRRLASVLEPGARKVCWQSREPIVLSPGFKVKQEDQVKIMGSGLQIGGPKGTGPARKMSTCIATAEGADLFFASWHPHRKGLSPKVDDARDQGATIAGEALRALFCADGGTSGAYETDYNERQMPRMVPGEKVAHHHDLDHLRFVENDGGAKIRLLDHGQLRGTIDGHDPIWALFRVTGRAA